MLQHVEPKSGRAITYLVLHGLIVDLLNDGAGHSLGIELDPLQQRLQPALRRLHVRVQEGEHLGACLVHAGHARAHQTAARRHADELHLDHFLHSLI